MSLFNNKITAKGSPSPSSGMKTSANRNAAAAVNNNKTAVGTSGGFYKGQTLKGEVIDLRDKDVKIQLEDSRIISAKLDGNMNVSIGDRATFLVTDSGPYNMSLKMITAGAALSKNYMIDKALDEAGLPHTERNMMAVKELLNSQLSINKSAIMDLLRQASTFKNASLGTLVIMNKYQMPINEVTTSQFEAYRNFEHRISNQLTNLCTSLTDALYQEDAPLQGVPLANKLINMVSTENLTKPEFLAGKETLAQNIEQFLSVDERLNLIDSLEKYGLSSEAKIGLLSGNISLRDAAQAILKSIENLTLQEQANAAQAEIAAAKEPSLLQHAAMTQEGSEAELLSSKAFDPILFPAAVNSELLDHLPEPLAKAEVFTVLSQYISAGRDSLELATFLPLAGREQLLQALAPLNFPENIKHMIREGTISANDLLPAMKHLLTANPATAEGLLKNSAFAPLLKELLLSHWTLSPKALTMPNAIEHYYERLDAELRELEHVKNSLEQQTQNSDTSGEKGGGFRDQAENLRNNIDFMKTLNQMFSYFQMPMRLSGKNVHSELFVYTNKKTLRQDKDHIRVLLHLDMEHLGPLDVHLELTGKKITSKFYVDLKESAPLITEHLPMLRDELNKKGFTLSGEVLKRNKEIDIVDDFISPKETGMDMKRYTFDIRA